MTDSASLPADLLAAIDKAEIDAAAIKYAASDDGLRALAAAVVGFARAHRRIVERRQILMTDLDAVTRDGLMFAVLEGVKMLDPDLLDVAGCYGLAEAAGHG